MSKRSDAGDTTCPYRRTGYSPEPRVWRLESLTAREKEVFLLLGTGQGNRELARELGIAERTVKAHIANIVAKLGERTRTQAAIVSALAHGSLCTDPMCSRRLGQIPRQRRAPSVA
ncbi:helix-turn-helix domain-containing protein [Streptomyces glomeratus]|uniref:HTH luxR-type domain-containing protein n=1 Tax=Streptomyces glomeratus TaxID=284452 RepID=A0ABP6L369_9ACTN|nr:LuxR C-terminal-related transcriptional regulator [Streptomyces glomeratus]